MALKNSHAGKFSYVFSKIVYAMSREGQLDDNFSAGTNIVGIRETARSSPTCYLCWWLKIEQKPNNDITKFLIGNFCEQHSRLHHTTAKAFILDRTINAQMGFLQRPTNQQMIKLYPILSMCPDNAPASYFAENLINVAGEGSEHAAYLAEMYSFLSTQTGTHKNCRQKYDYFVKLSRGMDALLDESNTILWNDSNVTCCFTKPYWLEHKKSDSVNGWASKELKEHIDGRFEEVGDKVVAVRVPLSSLSRFDQRTILAFSPNERVISNPNVDGKNKELNKNNYLGQLANCVIQDGFIHVGIGAGDINLTQVDRGRIKSGYSFQNGESHKNLLEILPCEFASTTAVLEFELDLSSSIPIPTTIVPACDRKLSYISTPMC